MLGPYYRIAVKNAGGVASGAITITASPWKPGANGEKSFGTSVTLLSATSVASGAWATGTAQNNTTTGYYGLVGIADITGGTSDIDVELWLELSENNTTWPTQTGNNEGVLLGVVAVPANTTVRYNIEF